MPKLEKEKNVRRSTRNKPYAMTDVDQKSLQVFLSTGRCGRRNAMADVMEEKYANTSTADLPNALEGLCCQEEAASICSKDGQKKSEPSLGDESADRPASDQAQGDNAAGKENGAKDSQSDVNKPAS